MKGKYVEAVGSFSKAYENRPMIFTHSSHTVSLFSTSRLVVVEICQVFCFVRLSHRHGTLSTTVCLHYTLLKPKRH